MAHEQAWAEALAEEHAHQRELLATLRDELGTFARVRGRAARGGALERRQAQDGRGRDDDDCAADDDRRAGAGAEGSEALAGEGRLQRGAASDLLHDLGRRAGAERDGHVAADAAAGNPTCNKFHPVAGKPNEAVWHHANTDGCTHNGIQHDGTVHVTVTTSAWRCTASFFGTLTQTGASSQRCTRR